MHKFGLTTEKTTFNQFSIQALINIFCSELSHFLFFIQERSLDKYTGPFFFFFFFAILVK